ncbi:hypothetical protein V5O48_007898 [Marasmius crinis-equi]|uniref:Uncharacterized protein n=1 Tax=Marasmius crinis-equi TaxID=585013 RepID=A0ABR3FFI6_9AGAR
MPCIKYPFSNSLFYWSSDPNGKDTIPAEDWERYGIPELKVEMWMGSFWDPVDYRSIQEYFQLKCYNLDGQQYARDRDYPEVIRGDPHDLRIVECDEPPEVSPPDHSRLMSPSTFSLVEAPSEIDKMKSKMQAQQEMDPKSNFLGWITKGFLKKSVAGDARPSESLETDSDAWITVGKEDC